MKTLLLHLHLLAFFYTSIVAIAISAKPLQEPLSLVDQSALVDSKVIHVPGHNDATFGPVPKDKQLFVVDFLEIAPTPIQTDRVVFVYLSGWIPPERYQLLNIKSPELGLVNATLKISKSGKFPDGSSDPLISTTIPFKSTTFRELHLAIRDESGEQVEHMSSIGGDVLLDFDFQVVRMFVKTGEWRFQVDVRLGDEEDTCLFAFELVQWLEGDGPS